MGKYIFKAIIYYIGMGICLILSAIPMFFLFKFVNWLIENNYLETFFIYLVDSFVIICAIFYLIKAIIEKAEQLKKEDDEIKNKSYKKNQIR